MTFTCYEHKRDTYFDKLNYRDLWIAVGQMTRFNNNWKYDQLTDENKSYLKSIFQQIGENIPIDIESIESDSHCLKVITKNERYQFRWEYEKVNYIKEYGGIISLPNYIIQC